MINKILKSLNRSFFDFRLEKKQVVLIKKKINSLEEVCYIDSFPSYLVSSIQLADNYDIIINCIGYGAKDVCNDSLMRPIRGQMIRVRAPWIKHFYYTDDNCYMIPK